MARPSAPAGPRRLAVGAALVVLVAALSEAAGAQVLAPGVRVRASVPSDVIPPDGGVFVGTLVGVGDTLHIGIASGVVKLTPDMLVGLEVSEGARRYPYWMVAVGGGVGLAAGVPAANAATRPSTCRRFCLQQAPVDQSGLKRAIVLGGSSALGMVLGGVVAEAQSRERWRPARRMVALAVGPDAASVRVAL